ncbi:MAG TPA: ABC transporter ATP-binding protein, partial [Ktedonobacterales bacterium]|nr:ABC transporter ATP-binding protein [Ktedonobacterales bacterium]
MERTVHASGALDGAGSQPGATDALRTTALGKRYGGDWALRDCDLRLPAGRVAALVGPNGAGKTTLLHLIVGLLGPTAGAVSVFDHAPRAEPTTVLPLIGFVAQDHPLYRSFTVADMLEWGRRLNSRWDGSLARARLGRVGIPLDRRIGKLSGGQQAQVALAVAVAKRPRLLVLDEPVASLDPLARREFLRALQDAATEDGLTVLLSSHIIADLEQVCDYLIILASARVQLAGDIEEITRTHWMVSVPRQDTAAVAAAYSLVETIPAGARSRVLARTSAVAARDGWDARPATLEEIVIGYLGQSQAREGAEHAARA